MKKIENNPIYIGNGIWDQIKHFYYSTGTITKKGVFKLCLKEWLGYD